MRYKITYFAPFASAGFTCEANSVAEARELRQTYHDANGYCLPNREIKSETFGGRKVSNNGQVQS